MIVPHHTNIEYRNQRVDYRVSCICGLTYVKGMMLPPLLLSVCNSKLINTYTTAPWVMPTHFSGEWLCPHSFLLHVRRSKGRVSVSQCIQFHIVNFKSLIQQHYPSVPHLNAYTNWEQFHTKTYKQLQVWRCS